MRGMRPARDLRGLDEAAPRPPRLLGALPRLRPGDRRLMPTGDGHIRELPVSGNEWYPACVAVARLRRAVFSPPPGWIGDGE